jgi:hypothetical protein
MTEQPVEAAVNAMRIVVGGLIMGLVALSAMGLLLAPLNHPPDPQLSQLMLGGLAVMAVGCSAAYFVLRAAMMRDLSASAAELRQSPEPATLILLRYRQFAIAGAGLIDGPGMVAGLTYLMTANPVALGVIAGVVLLLLAHMPSVDSLRRLAERAAMGNAG